MRRLFSFAATRMALGTLAFAGLLHERAHAQASQIYWRGPAGADWNTAAHWDRGFVPGTNEYVYIEGDSLLPSDYTAGIKRLTVGSSTTSGSLTIDGGILNTSDVGYLGYESGITGLVTLNRGAWHNGSHLRIGNYGSGSLVINGGTVSNTMGFLGYYSGSNGTVVVNGGAWHNTYELYIGNNGAGTLTINGGTVTNTTAVLAAFRTAYTASSATVTVNGGVWNNTAAINAGYGAAATINLNGGTVLVNNGAGTVYLGYTTGSSGTLNLGTGTTVGTLNAAVVEGVRAATVNFNHTETYAFAPKLTGTLSLNHLGGGTTSLGAANTFSGTTTLSAGIIQANVADAAGSGALGNGGAITFAGGTLQYTTLSAGTDYAARFKSSAAAVSLDTHGSNVALAGVIDATNTGGLAKLGAGTLTLTAANTYSGGTVIRGGTLAVDADAALGTGTLTLDGGTLHNTGPLLTPRTVLLGAAGGTFEGGAGYLTFTSALSGTGGLTKTQGGLLTLHGAQTYAGATAVLGGSLKIADGSLASPSVSLAAGTALLFSTNGSYGGGITGAGTLRRESSGVTILTGNATHTGGTVIESGTLQIGNGGTAGSIAGTITNGGMLVFNRSDDTSSGPILAGGGAGGALVKHGAGTLTLNATNTYAAGTTLHAGTLGLAADGALGSGTLTINGGNLRAVGSPRTLTNAIVANGSFTLGRATHLNGAITLGADVTLTSANPDNQPNTFTSTLGGVISGAHGLTFTEGDHPTGRIVLAGANTYTGATRIERGTVALSATGSLAHTTAIRVGDGATFDVSAVTGGLTLNAGQTLGGGGTVVGATAIASGGHLAPGNSPGTLTLTGSTTWNGGADYTWEINDAHGAAGSAYDLVSISGSLTLAATAENKFTLTLISLMAANTAGAVDGFDAAQNYTYTIASAAGGISGFDAGAFTIDTARFAHDLAGGLWSLAVDGHDLNLNFTAASPIPEPSTYAAALAVAALAITLSRRRRTTASRA